MAAGNDFPSRVPYPTYLQSLNPVNLANAVSAMGGDNTCAEISKTENTCQASTRSSLTPELSHGFIYKGYREWIDPVMEWWLKSK